MMEFMNRITDKPGWEKKAFDENVTKKWKSEALAAPGVDISEKMVDWVGKLALWSYYSLLVYEFRFRPVILTSFLFAVYRRTSIQGHIIRGAQLRRGNRRHLQVRYHRFGRASKVSPQSGDSP